MRHFPALFVLAALAFLSGRSLAAAPRDLLQLVLEEKIETKEFANPMTLKDFLGMMYETLNMHGHEVPILVDTASFRRENPDSVDPYDAQVQLPPVPRRMTMDQALRLVLDRLPTRNATFLVREHFIEITTEQAASLPNLLKQKVLARYKNRRLDDILQELSNRNSVNIILDQRLGERVKQEVTATFRNDASLKDTLALLTRMTGLTAEFLPHAVFVTSGAGGADKEDRKEEEKPVPAEELKAPKDKKEAEAPDVPPSRNELIRVLNEDMVETKDFTTPMTLKDALGLLYEKYAAKGHEVPIIVNSAAFRAQDSKKDDAYDYQVHLPPVPRKLLLGKALNLLIAQLHERNATFLVKDGYIEVLPESATTAEVLLAQPVVAVYEQRLLAEVLRELADHSGVSIALDSRLGSQARTEVSATFRNDITVRDAVSMLARMAGLRAEFPSTGVFITTPSREGPRP